MRDIAIKRVISFLLERKVPLRKMKALDFFAREGDWQTAYYAPLVEEIHAWEINPEFEENLKKNLPSNARIVIGDSHAMSKKTHERFDMVVLDNPLGCYSSNYCEHFDALECATLLLRDSGIIVLNVKTRPYNLDRFPEWKRRRDEFYEIDASNLELDFVDQFYKKKFSSLGFDLEFSKLVERPQEEHLYEYVASIRRKNIEAN